MRRSMPPTRPAPIRRRASRSSCCPRPIPRAPRPALRSGEVDVMWGGPLRVMLTHAQDPAADSVCFCDVVARDPFFIIGREPRPDFRIADLAGLRFASVAEVPTPWLCLQDDLRRAGVDPATLNRISGPTHGRQRGGAARRHARCGAAVPALCRGADRLGRRPCVVRRRGPRPHRLHHAGDAPPAARGAARRAAAHDPRRWRARCAGSPRRRAAEIARALRGLLPRSPRHLRRRDRPLSRAETVRARPGARGARASIGCRRRCGPAVRSIAGHPVRDAASTIRSRGRLLADLLRQA